jgi:hypothetical protein
LDVKMKETGSGVRRIVRQRNEKRRDRADRKPPGQNATRSMAVLDSVNSG